MKKLFYLIILCIPLNLGKHFIIRDSYVRGLLIDYLIPTVYVIDLMIFALIAFWIAKIIQRRKFRHIKTNSPVIILSFLYVFSLFLSFLIAPRIIPSLYQFISTLLHFGFFLFILEEVDLKKDMRRIALVASVSVLLISLLGVLQWLKQGAVFNNYLILGEQPYAYNTVSIVKENVFGNAMIPPYGTFRHPNVLAAFLSVFLILIFANKSVFKSESYFYFVMLLGTFVLFISWSKVTWFCYIYSLVTLYLLQRFQKRFVGWYICISLVTVLLLCFIPYWLRSSADPSLYMRGDLINAAFQIIKEKPAYGVGLNMITIYVSPLLKHAEFLRFIQPPHNMYLLIFSESGIFAFTLFLLILSVLLHSTYKSLIKSDYMYAYLLINFVQILILGSFDHYFITIVQTSLLFWLTLGLCMKYNLIK